MGKSIEVLGIDIGGSGIKAAPVDLNSGEMTAERFRMDTPVPAIPEAVADVIVKICEHFKWAQNFCRFTHITFS